MCKLDEGYCKNIFNDWNLTFPSNDLEKTTYSLIVMNKMISATMLQKIVHQYEQFSSTEMIYTMQVMKVFFLN